MKLLAIDGNSILNRAFYGVRLLTTKNGTPTNGVYGFINILHKLLEQEKPDGVVVAFDVHEPTFRHKMYADYKAGRRQTPEELLSQFPLLKEWLRLAGYHTVELGGYEADDILGTFAKTAEQTADTCVIATGDRDSLQLISDQTRVLLTVTKMGRPEVIDYTPETLLERYGLTPHEMIELKALMGDTSDHIPGVTGVGEKTATTLIKQFHDIDTVYAHLDDPSISAGLRAKLEKDKESAYLSRTLGTICCEVPIDTNFEHYRIRPREEDALAQFMTGLELFKLMDKMGLKPQATFPLGDSLAAAIPYTVGICPETFDNTVTLWQAENGVAGVCGNLVFPLDEEHLLKLLESDTPKRVYDYKNLYKKYPTVRAVVFDAMLAGYLCNPSASSYAPDRLMQEYGGTVPEIEDEQLRDGAAFSETCDRLTEALRSSGQESLLREIELPLARVLAQMELRGFSVDPDGLRRMGKDLSDRIAVIEREIYGEVGHEFNLNSPKQLGIALFEELGITPAKKTKSGYSTAAEVLESLQYNYPIVAKVLEYRQLAKLKSTYCDGLLNAVAEDGRVHSTFNQTETRTGRISSLEPNLQNIPIRTEEGRKLREYFTTENGWVLCDADYSQIELRVLASMANDRVMIDAFNSETDIHTLTASQVFGMPADMVTPLLRRRAKAVNFGIIYGIGAFSLSKDIGVSRAEADAYIKGYLATYPNIAKYMDDVITKAKQNGYVSTLFGRRRYLPELASSNHMMRAFGERVARNAPIQGTAADIIKIAMIRVSDRLAKELPQARLILQVHDELIVECPAESQDTACRILTEEMENAVQMAVRLSVDAHCGKNWLEAKG